MEDLPSHGGDEQQMVARLSAASKAAPGGGDRDGARHVAGAALRPEDGPEPGAAGRLTRTTPAHRPPLRWRAGAPARPDPLRGGRGRRHPRPVRRRGGAQGAVRLPRHDGRRAVRRRARATLDAETAVMVRTGVERLRLALYWSQAQPDPTLAPDFGATERIVGRRGAPADPRAPDDRDRAGLGAEASRPRVVAARRSGRLRALRRPGRGALRQPRDVLGRAPGAARACRCATTRSGTSPRASRRASVRVLGRPGRAVRSRGYVAMLGAARQQILAADPRRGSSSPPSSGERGGRCRS